MANQGNENDQSYLSKGIDAVQQTVFGQGSGSGAGDKGSEVNQEKQDVHAAVDEAHPEKISEFMRDQHMSITKGEQEKADGKK